MSHLSIYINDIPVNTSPDASLDIEDKNPLFNDEEMFSYPIEIPFATNREITKSLDSPQAGIRPVDLEHSPMRVLVDGLPFRSGTAVVSDGEELESAASVSMEASEQSFFDLISDLKCTDIPLADKIKIGEKLGEVNVTSSVKAKVKIDRRGGLFGKTDYHYELTRQVNGSFVPQALGFSQPAVLSSKTSSREVSYQDGVTIKRPKYSTSFINVSTIYPHAKYCNARVCYSHHALDAEGKTDSGIIKEQDSQYENEDIYPFWVLDADRPQSGICFYVLYFLDCLFKHLGVQYDNTAINFGDFQRLCFYTTKCKYTEEPLTARPEGSTAHDFNSLDSINSWLDSHGMGGQIELTSPEDKDVDSISIPFAGRTYTYTKGEDSIHAITISYSVTGSPTVTADINAMYATSDNFPEMTVQSLIDSLENQFGIKFHYDYQRNKVTAYLLRDVFRSQASAIDFAGTIDSVIPISEKITGVRCGYSDESDVKEQRENVKNGVKDYDTSYDYIDYQEGRTVIGTNLYEKIFRAPGKDDLNVYVDLTTGNKYRIKIDSEYTDSASMNPRLFEVGQWKSVEEGDCSTKNEDFIKELMSDLQPLPLTDINYRRIIKELNGSETVTVNANGDTSSSSVGSVTVSTKKNKPILVAFMDEDMEHEFVEQRINNLIQGSASLFAQVYATEVLKLVESYDPSNTDDGNSPLQTYDWGNAIAIMRGGGNDAGVDFFGANYDGFGNSKWAQVVDVYALSTDLVDQFGNVYDYNGTIKGLALDGAFSLKPRSYVMPDIKVINRDTGKTEKYVDQDGNLLPLVQADTTGENSIRYKSRGYVDTFLSELIYFYLHRKYFKITVKTTAAALADIPNHWRSRWNIGGITGFIDKVSYSISQQDGIQQADIYLYAI